MTAGQAKTDTILPTKGISPYSFDKVNVGEKIGQSLVKRMGKKVAEKKIVDTHNLEQAEGALGAATDAAKESRIALANAKKTPTKNNTVPARTRAKVAIATANAADVLSQAQQNTVKTLPSTPATSKNPSLPTSKKFGNKAKKLDALATANHPKAAATTRKAISDARAKAAQVSTEKRTSLSLKSL